MKKTLLIVAMLCVVVGVISCKKKSSDDTSPTATDITLSPSSFSANANGDASQFTVTAPSSWSASTSDSWVHLSSSSGASGATLDFSADGNATYTSRSGSITITAGSKTATFSISQAGQANNPCTGNLSASYIPMAVGNAWLFEFNYYVSGGERDSIDIPSTQVYGGKTYYMFHVFYGLGQDNYYYYLRIDPTTQNIYQYSTSTSSEAMVIPGSPTVGQQLGVGEDIIGSGFVSARKVSSITATVTTSYCTYSNCLAIQTYNTSTGYIYATVYYKKGIGFVKTTDDQLHGLKLH